MKRPAPESADAPDRPGTLERPATPACCAPLDGPLLDEEAAETLAGLMKALSDPVRLRLLSLIATAPGGEVCACDLAAPLERSQPTVSHHLTVLTKAGMIEREQRGKWAWFKVCPDQLGQIADAVRLPVSN